MAFIRNDMEKEETPKLIGKLAIVLDLLLAIVFFAIMAFALRPFIPFNGQEAVKIWATITAAPMAGVFWLVIQMFRVTLTDQLRSKV